MMFVPAPSEKEAPEDTFKQLASDFDLSKEVLAHMLLKKMKTLRDFRFWFSNEDECKTFVAEIRGIDTDDKPLQVSKLRQAWASVKNYIDFLQKDKSAGAGAELEDMLSAQDLETRKTNF